MSGHSKWSQIKRQKGAADVKRSSLFTKLANNIAVAARDGKDPDMNFRLRLAIDRARAANMPNDNIDRAVKRGAGELEGQIIEEITYEAYGPGGAALVIRVLSDNKNRSASEVRTTLNKYNGNLGAAGSVVWNFTLKGVIRVEQEHVQEKDIDTLSLELVDAGAEDIAQSEEGLTIFTAVSGLAEVQSALHKQNIAIAEAGLEYVPNTTVALDEKASGQMHTLIDALEELDDVDAVFTNAQ
ncbi:MAG: YebC/PmpR family DNA-binding transcriptional regulator [Candidatus Nomurabacteria bacterium]|nr:MAG: YebC/PmpR family DNA-binding transcriptional regulator [Candidatus Nomurabacteria bacterium]